MEENASKIVRIALTGPESTGKSTLAAQLANYYQTVYRPEYARQYIDELNRPYVFEDIATIARKQFEIEKQLEKKAKKILFLDTDYTVLKIWSEHVFKHCDKWIIQQFEKDQYDLYLLMDIDIEWVEDKQREHPHIRKYLFDVYYQTLQANRKNFAVVAGKEQERFENAVSIINHFIGNKTTKKNLFNLNLCK